jgi:predicted DNA-binding transcriptional regulator YafY
LSKAVRYYPLAPKNAREPPAVDPAPEFEVSVRTIYRDIDELSAAEVPIFADRGPNGGFELLEGYRTRLTGLSAREAATLFLAGLPGPAAELGLADLLATAQLKLTAALPEGARAAANRVAARFHLDPVGWFRSAEDARFLPLIAEAVWNEKVLSISYRRAGHVAARTVSPLGLVLKGGIWYLVAQVGDQRRTYRAANIVELTVTDERFERPQDFDLAAFWTRSSHAYEVGLFRGTATLRVSPRGMALLEQLGSPIAQTVAEAAAQADAEGWVCVVVPIERVDATARDLIRFGTEVEVIEPAELRRSIAAMARELCRLYDG